MGGEVFIMEAAYRNWENENFDPVGKAAQRPLACPVWEQDMMGVCGTGLRRTQSEKECCEP